MLEEWKPSYIYPEQYEVSTLGRVRNKFTGNIMRQQIDAKGYHRVRLSYKNRKASAKVHRLVATAFIPNPDAKPQVNHRDGNKANNNLDNLEWATNQENQIHAFAKGLNYVTGRAGRPKIGVIQKSLDGVAVNSYSSIGEASRATGIERRNIGKVIHQKHGTAGGYLWERKEGDAI